MTYLPFVYLILLSPEQYYTNNLRIQNGYQPMPVDYAKKIDVRDKIQQPVVYLPYVLLSPFRNVEELKDNNAEETGKGAESEGNMDDDNNNKENSTLSTSTVVKVGYNLPLQQCTDGYFKDDNGNCLKGITKKEKEFELDRKKRAAVQQQNSSGRMIFKLSKKISVRDKRSAEEKKLSYADVVKYGRRRPIPLAKEMTTESATSKILPAPTAKTTRRLDGYKQPAPLLPIAIPVPSDKYIDKPSKPIENKSSLKSADDPKTATATEKKPPESKLEPNPPKFLAGKESSLLINSEAAKNSEKQLPAAESPPKGNQTKEESWLYLVTAVCENGYVKDENGNCIKSAKKKNSDKFLSKLDRKRRDTDRIKMLKEIMDAEDRIVDKRNQQHSFYYKRAKKIENDTLRTEKTFASPESPISTPNPAILDKTPDKNAASDGFGYISKECSKLVPGLVSDGAGGCTKSVKPKEKILQLERRKRQARTAYINFIDPNNVLRRNNFTIRITLKGFNKQLNFTGESKDDETYDDGNKAVADNGFGVTSSKCENLVPGLVPDGVGGCTKAVSTKRKRNKFSFILKNVENTQPLIDVEYENPETELVHSNDSDPDADII